VLSFLVGTSHIVASVVIESLATEIALCNAFLTTLVGSKIPSEKASTTFWL
jgi:hypothetical protein